MDPAALQAYNEWRLAQGMPSVGTRKRLRGLYLSQEAWEGLQNLADEHNLRWGGQPSVSQVVELIGLGDLTVLKLDHTGYTVPPNANQDLE